MSSKELIGQIEALAKVNTAYESQILELGKVLTATDAEAKRAGAALRLTQAGLAKSETHAGRLSNEIAQLKTKLSAEVQANATDKLHWAQQEAALNKNFSQLQKEHDATLKSLKASQLTLQQTQAECTELKANLMLTRDKYSEPRPALSRQSGSLALRARAGSRFSWLKNRRNVTCSCCKDRSRSRFKHSTMPRMQRWLKLPTQEQRSMLPT